MGIRSVEGRRGRWMGGGRCWTDARASAIRSAVRCGGVGGGGGGEGHEGGGCEVKRVVEACAAAIDL